MKPHDLVYKGNQPDFTKSVLDFLKAYNSDLWPKAGSGKAYIWEAVSLVGSAEYGEQWDGTELSVLSWPQSPEAHYSAWKKVQEEWIASATKEIPASTANDADAMQHAKKKNYAESLRKALLVKPAIVAEQQVLWESSQAAYTRLISVSKLIGDWGRDGKLKCYQQVGDGFELHEIPPSKWNCSSDLKHWLAHGAMELYVEAAHKVVRCEIFVDRATLDKAINHKMHRTEEVVVGSQYQEAYLSPFIKLGLHVAKDWDLSDDEGGKVDSIKDDLIAAAPDFDIPIGNDGLSDGLAKSLATLIRHHKFKKGRGK